MRVWLTALGLLWLAVWTTSCSGVSVQSVFNKTPTPPPTQVQLPTRIAVAVPTDVPNLIPAGDNSEAVQMLNDFVQAVSLGDLSGAMTYWDTSQPGQPTGYEANVRKMVQGWIDKKTKFGLGDISYTGPDGTGKSIAMPMSDPRVEKATAKVKVDGADYLFYMVQLKGGWFISGVNTAPK